MKKDIHPEYNKALVHCACGHEFETGSTLKAINVEICSQCHPFFTGKQKLVDTAKQKSINGMPEIPAFHFSFLQNTYFYF